MAHRGRVQQARNRAGNEVGLGRVQIAAGGIDAQRPTAGPGLFPGGQRQTVIKQARNGFTAGRGGINAALDQGPFIGGTNRLGKVIERKDVTPGITPEGIGLRRPIEEARSRRIGMEAVFGGFVVGDYLLEGAGHDGGL